MKTKIKHEALNYKEIIVDESFWTGKHKVYIDGKELEYIGNKKFIYINEENETQEITLVGSYMKGLILNYNNNDIKVYEKIKIYEYILIFIPFILAFLGGLVGGLVGGLAASIIFAIIRKIDNILIKISASLVISGIAWLVWDIVVTMILNSIE